MSARRRAADPVGVVVVGTLREGIGLLYELADPAASTRPMLVVPAITANRHDLGLTDHDLVALASAIGAETPATFRSSRWPGGPVLAVGLDPTAVADLASDDRTTALVCADHPPECRRLGAEPASR